MLKKKVLSAFMAVMLAVGVGLAPMTTALAADEESTTTTTGGLTVVGDVIFANGATLALEDAEDGTIIYADGKLVIGLDINGDTDGSNGYDLSTFTIYGGYETVVDADDTETAIYMNGGNVAAIYGGGTAVTTVDVDAELAALEAALETILAEIEMSGDISDALLAEVIDSLSADLQDLMEEFATDAEACQGSAEALIALAEEYEAKITDVIAPYIAEESASYVGAVGEVILENLERELTEYLEDFIDDVEASTASFVTNSMIDATTILFGVELDEDQITELEGLVNDLNDAIAGYETAQDAYDEAVAAADAAQDAYDEYTDGWSAYKYVTAALSDSTYQSLVSDVTTTKAAQVSALAALAEPGYEIANVISDITDILGTDIFGDIDASDIISAIENGDDIADIVADLSPDLENIIEWLELATEASTAIEDLVADLEAAETAADSAAALEAFYNALESLELSENQQAQLELLGQAIVENLQDELEDLAQSAATGLEEALEDTIAGIRADLIDQNLTFEDELEKVLTQVIEYLELDYLESELDSILGDLIEELDPADYADIIGSMNDAIIKYLLEEGANIDGLRQVIIDTIIEEIEPSLEELASNQVVYLTTNIEINDGNVGAVYGNGSGAGEEVESATIVINGGNILSVSGADPVNAAGEYVFAFSVIVDEQDGYVQAPVILNYKLGTATYTVDETTGLNVWSVYLPLSLDLLSYNWTDYEIEVFENGTGEVTVPGWAIVSFNTDGGSEVDSQTVRYGDSATEVEDPTKDGYTFAGWYYEDAEFDFDGTIGGDIEVTALWTANDVDPDDGGDDADTDGSDTDSDASDTDADDSDSKDKLAATGDNTSVMLMALAGALVIAGAGLVVCLRKFRK